MAKGPFFGTHPCPLAAPGPQKGTAWGIYQRWKPGVALHLGPDTVPRMGRPQPLLDTMSSKRPGGPKPHPKGGLTSNDSFTLRFLARLICCPDSSVAAF